VQLLLLNALCLQFWQLRSFDTLVGVLNISGNCAALSSLLVSCYLPWNTDLRCCGLVAIAWFFQVCWRRQD
jgi:hypothetical protein